MFGWTHAECMSTPARAFFRLLREARIVRAKENYRDFVELVDIVMCANVSSLQYPNELKTFYRRKIERLDGDIKEEPGEMPNVIKANSPEAGRQIMALSHLKMRLAGHA